jgi:hypothetical protein
MCVKHYHIQDFQIWLKQISRAGSLSLGYCQCKSVISEAAKCPLPEIVQKRKKQKPSTEPATRPTDRGRVSI